MISKRWRNRKVIPKAYALAIKSRLGVSKDKFRELTRMLRKQGVNVENETAQRKLQQNILPQDSMAETHNFSFKNGQKEEYFRQTQAIFIENIENYLFNLLNQYQSQNELSWHGGSIPEEKIWVKIGGDHGQGSLKVTLQTLNVEKPNSKFFTSIIAMANVPDNVKNLRILLNRFIDQINALKVATWNGKKICVFLCGDYHFLTDVHGISGSSGTHPCLWCLQTNTEIDDPRDSTNPPKLEQMKTWQMILFHFQLLETVTCQKLNIFTMSSGLLCYHCPLHTQQFHTCIFC